MSLLGLDKLEPKGRLAPGSRIFTAREWREIFAARRRGISWAQIQARTKRYPKASSLSAAASVYFREQGWDVRARRRSRAKKNNVVPLRGRTPSTAIAARGQ